MPVINGNYVAPVWENNKGPALNAENLNDLSSTAEGAQVLTGTSAPTTSTKGKAGQWYLNVLQKADGTYDLYQCVAVSGSTYTWKLFDSASKYIAPAVAALLGLGEGATIEDALSVLAIPPAGTGAVIITCNDENGDPVSGCVITTGDDMTVTNAAGMAKFFFAPGTHSVAIRSPIDYGAGSQTVSVTAEVSQTITTEVTIEDESDGAEKSFASSAIVAFSSRVTKADVFVVGGGGAGGSVAYYTTYNIQGSVATGGAGGKTATVESIDTKRVFSLSIGSGGASKKTTSGGGTGSSGTAGGTTSVGILGGEIVASAAGGAGGKTSAGNVQGSAISAAGASGGSGSGAASSTASAANAAASGYDGTNGGEATAKGGTGQGSTTRAFGETDGELFASAGASVAVFINGANKPIAKGTVGIGGGEAAGNVFLASETAIATVASKGTTPGSGGGGAAAQGYNNSGISATSGAGANGIVIFRWEVSA